LIERYLSRKEAIANPLDLIKPEVRALRAYTLAPDRAGVKINQNENPWDAPARIKAESLRRLDAREWSRYPDFTPASLHARLAEFAEVISLPLTSELSYDTDALHRAVKDLQPDVTIICSPNNPTGCVLNDRDLRSLLELTNGLLVIDEAYHEFAEHSVVPLLGDYENLIVLRTFSKAMALAALRVGYLLAAPHLATEVSKAVLPYNLNAVSQAAAEVAVEMYEDELRPLVRRIIAERERLFGELEQIAGLTPLRSSANFMIVKSSIDPKQVFAELLKRNILIRDVSGYPMLRDYFRLSVGTPEENDLLLDALREICS
jgi:histidinol-phosphate aminotransferase